MLEALFTITISLVKFSILAFYRSVFPVPRFLRATLILAILCGVWFAVCFLVNIFQCCPINGAWDIPMQLDGRATCISYNRFLIGHEASNMLLDACILALPVWMLRRLQLSRAKKFVVGAVFLAGGL